MIIDTIDKLSEYVELNPLFADVVAVLKANDIQTMEPGKYPIKGDDVFLNLQVAKQRTKDTAFLETHIKMIDIQIPLDGDETYGYTPLCDLPETPYNAEKDITKYEGMAQSFIDCKPGMFAIFFPQDGHAPCSIEDSEIKKAIFKIKA